MPSDAEQLATIKSQVLANLVTITAGPKPSYNIDGQQISWTEYHKMLTEQLKEINALLAAEAPAEVHSYGYTGVGLGGH